MKHFLLSAFHLNAAAMLLTVYSTHCAAGDVFQQLGTKPKIYLLLLTILFLNACFWHAKR